MAKDKKNDKKNDKNKAAKGEKSGGAAALAALKSVKFESVTIEGSYTDADGGGYPVPGAASLENWSLQECDDFDPDAISLRATYGTSGHTVRLDFPISTEKEGAFKTGWKIIRGFIENADMDDDLREEALEASEEPGEEGNLAIVVGAIGQFTRCNVATSYSPQYQVGYPSFRALPIDTDLDEYVPHGLTAEEAAKARAEKAAEKADKKAGRTGKGGGKGAKRGEYEEE